jgi:hypothetical protein
LVPHGELISSLASLIQGVTSMVDFELLVRGRVPRASISSYEGLAGHLR